MVSCDVCPCRSQPGVLSKRMDGSSWLWHKVYSRLSYTATELGYLIQKLEDLFTEICRKLRHFSACFRRRTPTVANVVNLVRPLTVASLSYTKLYTYTIHIVYNTMCVAQWGHRASRGFSAETCQWGYSSLLLWTVWPILQQVVILN